MYKKHLQKITKCPSCGNPDIIKKGRRKAKLGSRQLYYCKICKSGFADSKLIHKTYGPKVIISAVTYYNLGNTLEESAKLTNKRFKVKVSKSSVSQWLKEFSTICTYYKLRKKILDDYGKEIIISKTFTHNGLAYNFKYHRPKLEILCGRYGFQPLEKYIENFSKKAALDSLTVLKTAAPRLELMLKSKQKVDTIMPASFLTFP